MEHLEVTVNTIDGKDLLCIEIAIPAPAKQKLLEAIEAAVSQWAAVMEKH